jgi:phosphate transport system substrate-binding protein
LANAFNRAFPTDHASIQIHGANAGVHALTAGVATVVMAARPAFESERRPFRQVFGQEPSWFRLGVWHLERIGRTPPAIYVNASNPLRSLTYRDLGRIATSGHPARDVTRWGQVGIGGRLAGRRIHVYGARDDGGFATNIRLSLFEARQFTPSYEALADDRAVLAAVRADPFGIAIVDETLQRAVPGVKRVRTVPAPDAISSRAPDPLIPYSLLYVTPSSGGATATSRFVEFALSAQGQATLSRAGPTKSLAALDPAAIAVERAAFRRFARAHQ